MKKALLLKPFTIKVAFSLAIAIALVGMPDKAHASFFSGLVTKIVGLNAQAAETAPVDQTNITAHNSQTVPLSLGLIHLLTLTIW